MSIFGAIAARVTQEPRNPDTQRVPYVGRTLAGVPMNADVAVTIPVVWACLRYVSQTVAALPWRVMRNTPRGGEPSPTHPINYLIYKRPNPEWSSFQFRETLTHWALRHGNGYAEIEPDMLGRPYALWPIHPERVEVCRAVEASEDDYGDPIEVNDLYYEISNGTGGRATLSARRIYHVRGFGEGPVGVNVIQYAAQSLGSALAAQLYAASFFGNGANVSGIIRYKKPFRDRGAMRLIREEINALYRGLRNTNKVAILDDDMDWKPIGSDPEKTQLVAVQQHNIEEGCRWFAVPPHKVGHLLRAHFSNIEHQGIEAVVDCITPWVRRHEDEADFKLFGQNRTGFYTKMYLNALMRGDMKSRMEFYRGMSHVGAYSPNRILQLEDEQTIGPEGDVHVMQEQYIPLKRIIEGPPEPIAPQQTAPAPEPDDDEPEDDSETDEAIAARARFEALMGMAPVEA